MSRHHWYITNNKIAKPRKNSLIEFKWNQDTMPDVRNRPPKDP